MNGSPLVSLAACLLAGHVMLGCSEQAPAATPPPLPPMPTLVPVPAEAEPVEAYAAPTTAAAREKKPTKSKPQGALAQSKVAPSGKTESHASAPKQTPAPRATTPAPTSAPRAEPAVTPAPAIPAPVARPVNDKRVVVPRTANVHIEFPQGLQADLDADPRMQSWVDKVIAIIDGCHGKNRSAKGTISTRITMHENDRPDADILSLPGQLSSVVACATGSLMRVKMPLFTGREGTRYAVGIVFE